MGRYVTLSLTLVFLVGLLGLLGRDGIGRDGSGTASRSTVAGDSGPTQPTASEQDAGLAIQTGSLDEVGGLGLGIEVRTEDGAPDETVLNAARDVLRRRIAGYGITGALVLARGGRIIVALPPVDNPEEVVRHLTATGLLEIIDPMGQYLPEGTKVNTSLGPADSAEGNEVATPTGPVYDTIVSGRDLADAFVTTGNLGELVVGFRLRGGTADEFYDFTSTHIGQPMSIVIDKTVISSPVIDGPISNEGIIGGLAPRDAAYLVVSLKAGPLPAPIQVVQSSTVYAVRAPGAVLYEAPSEIAREVAPLPVGAKLMVVDQSEVGVDGRTWWPVEDLDSGQVGYVREDWLD